MNYNCYDVRNMSDYIRFFSTFFLSCFIFVSFHVFITNWHYYCYFNSQILLSISHTFWIELLHIIFKLLRAIIWASNFIKSNFKLPLHYQNQFKSRINEWSWINCKNIVNTIVPINIATFNNTKPNNDTENLFQVSHSLFTRPRLSNRFRPSA